MGLSWRGAGALAALLGAVSPPALAQTTTQTTSSGTVYNYDYVYDGRRNETYSTQIVAYGPDGSLLTELFFNWAFGDAITQAGIAQITSQRIYTAGGTPQILVWSAPTLIEEYEEFLDSFTEVSITTESGGTFVTVQTTSGDAPNNIVYYGERGVCYSTGTSGSTNVAPITGSFAECDFAEELEVAPGTVNTNTHTTYFENTIERWFTNEDYLIISLYELNAVAVPVGAAHPAVQTSVQDVGLGFLERLRAEGEGLTPGNLTLASLAPTLPRRSDRVRFWSRGYGERASIDAGAGLRRSTTGAALGVVLSSGENWNVGFALDHGRSDIDVRTQPEDGDIAMTQLGAHAGYDWGDWFFGAAGSYGAGDVDLMRGDAALGGVSQASFDAELATAGVQAGRRFTLGDIRASASAGLDWVNVHTDAFEETGGIPLAADAQDADRTMAWLGFGAEREWRWSNQNWLILSGRVRALTPIDGEQARSEVYFVGAPTTPLEVLGYEEGETGEATLSLLFGVSSSLALQLSVQASGNDEESSESVSGALRARW